MSKWYDPGKTGAKLKALQEQAEDSPGGGEGMSEPGAGEAGMSNGGNAAPDFSGQKDQAKGKDPGEDHAGDARKEAPREQRRRMQFMQYMREENSADREMLKEFIDQFDTPSQWEREDHFEDLRPSVWFRSDNHVVEVYATLGCIAAVFGVLPPVAEGTKDKQDYTMMDIVFPPVKIPHLYEDEDTGEVSDDYEGAKDNLKDLMEECADYIREQKDLAEDETRKKRKKASTIGSGNAGKESK
jgi:hypothetical protein